MADVAASDPVSAAWRRYRAAIEVLYGTDLGTIISSGERYAPSGDEEALSLAAEASATLTEVLAAQVEQIAAEARESDFALAERGYEGAALKALAAATIDLAIATDLGAWKEERADFPAWVDVAGREGSALSGVIGDALTVLEPPTGNPFDARVIAGGCELAPEEARALLRESIQVASQSIIRDTGSAAVSTVSILVSSGAERLAEAARFAFHDLLKDARKQLGRRGRWAVRFLERGIDKVLSTLDGQRSAVVGTVLEWANAKVEKLEGNLFESWLTRHYGLEPLLAELLAETDASTNGPAGMVNGAHQLDALASRYHSQTTFIRRAAWLIGQARKWLFHIHPPISEAAVIFCAGAATGCVVWLGDDYLDVPPAGWTAALRLVRGLDPIVREAL